MKIPLLDLKAAYQELKPEFDKAYERVLSSGRYVLGPEVEDFERAFTQLHEVSHGVAVNSGYDGLVILLRAFGVGVGDEVIVPAQTFIATWFAVSNVGAKPVPVDCDGKSFNINASLIEQAITNKTKAIIPVHLYGQSADMDVIVEIAKRHGLKVIEDAAQAHGAKYKKRYVGGLGDAAAFSLYPGKNLGAIGDAGIITTNNAELAHKLRMFRNCGLSEKHVHDVVGLNSRLDELQGAFLTARLKKLVEWNERRREFVGLYAKRLASISEIKLPEVSDFNEHVWHQYVVRTEKRNELLEHLNRLGIEAQIHYPTPPHLQKAYGHLGFGVGSFPVSEATAKRILSLPMGPHITTEQINFICESIQNYFKN